MRNFFIELDRNRGLDPGCLKERLRCADSQIVVALRDRGLVAAKLNTLSRVCFVDSHLIVERNWSDERVEFVETVLPSAKDFQRKIDFRRSEDSHIVMSSVVETSRVASQ